ncbi:hypothetical protein, partial [Fulvivirga aurantia]|uniref:hypothetical protein n=1 Tax=Fulvivirga aurantia TaxID=2529383 RepID=UPI001627A22C
ATGCTETLEVTVNDNLTTPVPITNVIDQSFCTPVNGEVSADVGGTTAGYNFFWFDGNVPTPNIAAPDFTGDTYSNLAAGDYTLV